VRRLVNGREEAITCRPADLLEPAMAAARRSLEREGVADPGPDAVVTYAMFPDDYLTLVRGEAVPERLGDEPPPEEPRPAVAAEPPASEPEAGVPAQPASVRELTVEVDGQSYSVRVIGGSVSVATPVAAEPGQPATVREGTVVAPMQGLLLKVSVGVGDQVNLGDVVAVLEAMKMQNDITATRTGRIARVHVKEGDVVRPRDPLVDIE
jgi:pyruvate carboxylase subunit B